MKFSKKIILILLIFIFLLSSCTKTPDITTTYGNITNSILADGTIETGSIPGDYIYRFLDYDSYSLLLKYHIKSGIVTTVCQDPFCDHGMSCPFNTGSSNMVFIGNLLYYVDKTKEKQTIISYDGSSMKMEEIYKSDNIISHLFNYNYYIYFTETSRLEADSFLHIVSRIDTKTGNFIELDRFTDSTNIYQIRDKKIIWKGVSECYSTELDGSGRKAASTEITTLGNYKYAIELKSDEPLKTMEDIVYDLYRIHNTTGEKTLVVSDAGPGFHYGDKYLYFKPIPEKRLIYNEPDINIYDYFGGYVYVVNIDGTDNKLLCHADDAYILGMSTSRNNEYVCGDYVGIVLTNYYIDEYGNKRFADTDMLIVNIITGEFTIARYNPFE